MSILDMISEELQNGEAKTVKQLVRQALDEGYSVDDILNKGLMEGMNVIGEKFRENEVFVPEVLLAARAMNAGMKVLKPLMVVETVERPGKVCLGTIEGDVHDIGKSLVKTMMESKGIEVIDLGTNVPPSVFVQTAIDEQCGVIACSTLLTVTMTNMQDLVRAVDEAGIHDRVKVMVGGAPVTEEFCQMIGADVYTPDCQSAAEKAVQLLKELGSC